MVSPLDIDSFFHLLGRAFRFLLLFAAVVPAAGSVVSGGAVGPGAATVVPESPVVPDPATELVVPGAAVGPGAATVVPEAVVPATALVVPGATVVPESAVVPFPDPGTAVVEPKSK